MGQAVGAVPLVLERAVVVRGADRAGFSRQILVRNGIDLVVRIGRRLAGSVDRDRTVPELVLRLGIVPADEERIARMVFGRVGVNGTVYRFRLVEGRGIERPAFCSCRGGVQYNRIVHRRANIGSHRSVNIEILGGAAGGLVPGESRPADLAADLVQIDAAAVAGVVGDQRLVNREITAGFSVDRAAIAACLIVDEPAVLDRQGRAGERNGAAGAARPVPVERASFDDCRKA